MILHSRRLLRKNPHKAKPPLSRALGKKAPRSHCAMAKRRLQWPQVQSEHETMVSRLPMHSWLSGDANTRTWIGSLRNGENTRSSLHMTIMNWWEKNKGKSTARLANEMC